MVAADSCVVARSAMSDPFAKGGGGMGRGVGTPSSPVHFAEKNATPVWGLDSSVAVKDVIGGNTSYMYSLLLMAMVSPRTGMTPLGQ